MNFLEKVMKIGLPVPDRENPGLGAEVREFDQDMAVLNGKPLLYDLFGVTYDAKGEDSRTVRFNRPVYANTAYGMKDREIDARKPISTTPTAFSQDQVSLTVTREGGPYDLGQKCIAPYCITADDLKFGVHNLVKSLGNQLRRDNVMCHEMWTVNLLDQFDGIYPNGATAVNDFTSKGTGNMSFNFLLDIATAMKLRKLPRFPGGKWVIVLTTGQAAQLLKDPLYRQWAHDHPSFNPLFQGHIGSVADFEIFESTTLNVTANTASTPVNIHYGHVFAPGALGYGMCGLPEVRSPTDDNYGLAPKAIWNEVLALGMVDQRFGFSIRTAEAA